MAGIAVTAGLTGREAGELRQVLLLPFMLRMALLPWWVTLVPAGILAVQGRPGTAALLTLGGLGMSVVAVVGVLVVSALRGDS